MASHIKGYPIDYLIFEILLWIGIIGLPIFVLYIFSQGNLGGTEKWLINTGVGGIWIMGIDASFIEPWKIKVKSFHFSIPRLPSLCVVLVSDIHMGPYKKDEWLKKVVHKINEIENIDAVIFPGDFVYGGAERYAHYLWPLQDIHISKKFAILGNHDHERKEPENTIQHQTVSSVLKKYGISELKNESFFWQEKGIFIIGLDDNFFGYHDLELAFKGVPIGASKIVIAHSPDIMDEWGAEYKPDLVVCGHTHGGQIRFPFLGAVPWTIPTRNGKSLEIYNYERHGIPVFISPGVGETAIRARLWNTPEIDVLHIN